MDGRPTPGRALALLATLALLASFGAVLFEVVDVAGDPTALVFLVAASLLGATLLARMVDARRAAAVGAALLLAGLAWYVASLPQGPRAVALLESNVELLGGQSIHQIRRSGVWALGVAPAPIFVTWYLALRRRYAIATLVGGAMLGYFVLTGDAGTLRTLLGVVGAAGMLGFGDLEDRAASIAGAEHVAVVLAVMVTVPLLVTVVPGGLASPLSPAEDGSTTVESSLLADDSGVTIGGDLELSPAVRFTIESPAERYWKASSYDRYLGDGWVRTGGTTSLAESDPSFPPGPRRTVRQTVEVESRLSTLPAAWRPVSAGSGVADRVRVAGTGDFLLDSPLAPGETYRVTSAVETGWDRRLRATGTDYREPPPDRYTRLPRSTPDRVARRTAEITAEADGPYETAVAIERWLEQNRNYSLSVDRPEDTVADSFLFEMESGYCTYFATTMVAMLRSQDVPARLATGYASGEQVAEDRWVVRGLDAHAWVEVYFADHGWVAFDPTPAGPRRDAERDRIEAARENGVESVDTDETRDSAPDESTATPDATESAGDNPATNRSALPPDLDGISVPAGDPTGGGPAGGVPVPELPSRETLALGAIVLAGAAAGLRRSGVGRWIRRTATVAWQPRVDPETDVERAFRRVAIVLERRHRPRRRGETVRQYLAALDAPAAAWRVAEIRERARYRGDVDPATADEAVRLADEFPDADGEPNRTPRPPDWELRGPDSV